MDNGQLKANWKIKRLDEACRVVNGGTPKTKIEEYWSGEHYWVTPAEMGNRDSILISKTRRTLTNLGIKNSSAHLVPPFSVILSTRAPIGHLIINTEPMAFNQGCRGLVPENNLEYKFLYYFLLSNISLLNDLGTGATFKELSATKLKSVEIPIPPNSEQKRIVAILDEAFAGISLAVANAEKNLANARELFESYLNNVFTQKGEGWETKELKDICSISSKLVDPKESQYINFSHIGAGNIVSMTGELIAIKTAKEEGLISGKFFFDSSMVLYSKIRPYLMKVCKPDFEGLCSADIYPLSVKNKELNRNFLYHILMSKNFTDYAISGSARAGMPKVNRGHLFSYKVSLPNLSEQKIISDKLDALFIETQHLEALYQQKLTALNELKQSLLQKAFTGQLIL